jgi:hypothetical protein
MSRQKQLWLLGLAFFLTICPSLAQAELNLLDPALNWRSPDPQTTLRWSEKGLTARNNKATIRLINLRPFRLSTAAYPLLKIKLRTNIDGLAYLFWAKAGDKLIPDRNYPFYVRGARTPQTYYLNLAAYDRERSPLGHFYFFPRLGSAEVELTELTALRGNIWQKTLAGWQEFWGPLSRTPDGFDFLVIRSPRLNGRPFIWELNLLLLGLLAIVLALGRKRELWRLFLLFLLILWALVEVNSLRGNWLSVKNDWPFLGKSLDEKRALLNNGDFYAFIKYADRELPPAASFGLATTSLYNRDRAAYYLYPRLELTAPPYLLVFERQLSRATALKYRPWKTFRPGAYILKAKNNAVN